MGFRKLHFVWMMMTIYLFINVADQCDVFLDASVDAIAGQDITMTCKVKNQTSDTIRWRTPEGFVINEKCESMAQKFKIHCSDEDNLHSFQLKFKGQWSDRGKYICRCGDTKKLTMLNMQVPVRDVTAHCHSKNARQECNSDQLSKYDTLHFTATSTCAAPVPTISWYIPSQLVDSQGTDLGKKPIDISKFGGTIDEINCSGQDEGLTKVVSTFSARWGQIDMTGELQITTSNEIGRAENHVHIQGSHAAPHDNLLVIYVVVAIASCIVFFLIVVFVRMNCKCIQTGNQFVYRPVLRSKYHESMMLEPGV